MTLAANLFFSPLLVADQQWLRQNIVANKTTKKYKFETNKNYQL